MVVVMMIVMIVFDDGAGGVDDDNGCDNNGGGDDVCICMYVLFSSLPIGAFHWPITSSVTLTFNLN